MGVISLAETFVIGREVVPGKYHFIRDLHAAGIDDIYTEDLDSADRFDETTAIRERVDDEFVAVLKFDEHGGIESYEQVTDESAYRSLSILNS